LNTDSVGAYFSKSIIDKNPDCFPLNFTPQIHAAHEQIYPSTIWREIAGCYTAKGDEEYLLIGNFASNGFSDCTGVDTTGYFIFVDDVTLMADKIVKSDTLLCEGEPLIVDGSLLRNEYKLFPNWKYKWNDGNTSSTRRLDKPGNYTLTVNLKDCVNDVYNFTITNKKCNCEPFIPTAFTPNGDLLNDIFLPKITCTNTQMSDYNFSIYDRWGTRVFYTQDINLGWDGKIKAVKATMGVYVYQVQYKISGSTKYSTAKGTVNLLQ